MYIHIIIGAYKFWKTKNKEKNLKISQVTFEGAIKLTANFSHVKHWKHKAVELYLYCTERK